MFKGDFLMFMVLSGWKRLTKTLHAITADSRLPRLLKPAVITALFVLPHSMWMEIFLEIGGPNAREKCIRSPMRWRTRKSEFFFLVRNAENSIETKELKMMKLRSCQVSYKNIVKSFKKLILCLRCQKY